MIEAKYKRQRATISGPDGHTKYDSISLAKKASREIQLNEAPNRLGSGVLQVIKPKGANHAKNKRG